MLAAPPGRATARSDEGLVIRWARRVARRVEGQQTPEVPRRVYTRTQVGDLIVRPTEPKQDRLDERRVVVAVRRDEAALGPRGDDEGGNARPVLAEVRIIVLGRGG